MARPPRTVRLWQVCCLRCRLRMRNEWGLHQHLREKHPDLLALQNHGLRRVRERPDIAGRGYTYCHNSKPKRVFYSIDEAWRWAFIIFVQGGFVLTPYRCGDYFVYRSHPRARRGGYTMTMGGHYGCGRWHLGNAHRVLALPSAGS